MSKYLPLIGSAAFLLLSCSGQDRTSSTSAAPPTGDPSAPAIAVTQAAAQDLETGCGSCVFGMEGVQGCQLAVKVDGKPYLVSGVKMPGHESGLCDHSRMAAITGQVEDERFVATSFALKP